MIPETLFDIVFTTDALHPYFGLLLHSLIGCLIFHFVLVVLVLGNNRFSVVLLKSFQTPTLYP